MRSEYINRREFVQLGGSFVLATLAHHLVQTAEQFTGSATEADKLQLPSKEKQLPPGLVGVGVNAPYLWKRSPEYQLDVLTALQAAQMGPVRLFITADQECMAQIQDLCQLARRVSAGKEHKLTFYVSLFDAYPLLHAAKPNLWYGSSALSSPFLFGAESEAEIQKAQLAFFTDNEVQASFHGQQRFQIESLRHIREIVAWEVANELEIPRELATTSEATTVLSGWYHSAVANIRDANRSRPIITGLAKPWLIDESHLERHGVVNSLHIYPHLFPTMQAKAREHVVQSTLPLMVSETGVSDKLPMTDTLLSQFIEATIADLTIGDVLHTQHLSVWKWDEYSDTFDFDLSAYPKTFVTIKKFQKLFANLEK